MHRYGWAVFKAIMIVVGLYGGLILLAEFYLMG